MPFTRRFVYSFCLLCLGVLPVSAQKTADLRKNGDKAFQNGRWEQAVDQYGQYQTAKPGDLEVLARLGISYFQLGNGEQARKYLEYVATRSPGNSEALYYLARSLHGLMEWEKAIAAYKQFLRASGEKNPLRDNAAENIRRCVQGMNTPENPAIALVENLGEPVNSSGDEFAPLPSVNYADRLYYAAARPGCNGGLRNNEGYEDMERGHWSSDMFAAQLGAGGWTAAGSLGGLLNSSRFEVPLGFNAKGQVLYFFRGFSTFSGEILADTAAKKDEYALVPPTFKSPVVAEQADNSPYFFNEKTIIFSSDRPGGLGGFDLWYTVFTDTAWTEPVNLGPAINSTYDETTPFLANDGKSLFFSSNKAEGIGGLDIYASAFDLKTQSWTVPFNLGIPVNSPGDDAYYRLASDGKAAFFSSDRLGGLGNRDLYIAYFKETETAQTALATAAAFLPVKNDLGSTPANDVVLAVPTLPYETDKDLLSPANAKNLDQIAAIARQHPEATVLVHVFTDDSGQMKFDLYYGIKRAEIIGKALTARGVAPGNILLRSLGSAFPLARAVLDGAPNPEAKRINQRVECTFGAVESLQFRYRLLRPEVSELMAANGIQQWDQQLPGLHFRVEVATTRQILTNDALAMFGDMTIESQPGTGAYQYTVGYFTAFEKAAQLQKEISGLGYTDAHIVAYINGLRVSKAEAVGLLKKHPGLAPFIKN